MKKIIFYILLFIFATSFSNQKKGFTTSEIKMYWGKTNINLYVEWEVFQKAMISFGNSEIKNKDILTLVDFSKPSTEKRFYVIDLKNSRLIYRCLVAHGKNTGNNKAVNFSNKPGSLKSSLGSYKTAETYKGKHGFSLRLEGLDKGINDNARKRAIVIHGAKYVSQSFINKHGRLGRSWGCPALPVKLSKKIINTISDGTFLYIYGK